MAALTVSAVRALTRVPEWNVIRGGVAVGFVGSVFMSVLAPAPSGPIAVGLTLLVVLGSVWTAYYARRYALWLVVIATLFPLQLQPYIFTVTVAAGVYVGVLAGVLVRRDAVWPWSSAWGASVALALAVLVSVAGSTLTDTALASDGGMKEARVFVFAMGLVAAVPLLGRTRSAARELVLFISFVAAGMSAYGILEYAGRLGWLPVVLPAWADDALTKSFGGAVSGAFIGGGPNTYAVFLTLALLLLTSEFASDRRDWARGLLVPAALIAINLAFTYSRGAYLAAGVGLVFLAVVSRPTLPRRLVLTTLGLLVFATASAFAIGTARAPQARGDSPSSHWRAFVADATWKLEQDLIIGPSTPLDRLWLKVRASSGSGYKMQITIDRKVVFEGRGELPQDHREWHSLALPPGLLQGKDHAVVEVRLLGVGNQRDHYFEIEGTTNPISGAQSHLWRGDNEIPTDLSFDPGTQRGRYLIQLETPSEVLSRDEPAEPKNTEVPTIVEKAKDAIVGAISSDERLPLWRSAIQSFQVRPLFGAGFSSSAPTLKGLGTIIDYANFHNEFLQFLADSGLIGLIGLLAFFSTMFWVLYALVRRADGDERELALALASAFIALVVAFQFGSFLADSRIAGLLWVLAGLVAVLERQSILALRTPGREA